MLSERSQTSKNTYYMIPIMWMYKTQEHTKIYRYDDRPQRVVAWEWGGGRKRRTIQKGPRERPGRRQRILSCFGVVVWWCTQLPDSTNSTLKTSTLSANCTSVKTCTTKMSEHILRDSGINRKENVRTQVSERELPKFFLSSVLEWINQKVGRSWDQPLEGMGRMSSRHQY